jgi:hypothetical protein
MKEHPTSGRWHPRSPPGSLRYVLRRADKYTWHKAETSVEHEKAGRLIDMIAAPGLREYAGRIMRGPLRENALDPLPVTRHTRV